MLGIATRLKFPGVFLFPGTSPDSIAIGALTLPVGRAYKDQLTATPWDDEPALLMLLYLSDVILTRFLDGLLNDNVFPEFSQPMFRRARELYAMRATAFSEADAKRLGLNETATFEDFVSQQLRFDYKRCRHAFGAGLKSRAIVL
jgi:hypothetical protein